MQCLQALFGKTLALQANLVHAETSGLAFGHDQRKRRHILGDHSGCADVGIAADAAELMHRRAKSNGGEVFDGHVTRQGRTVHEQIAVPNMTVVTHMGRRQKQIAIANGGLPATFSRAAADRHVLAKGISVAHDKLHVLAPEAEILRITTNRAERVKHIVPPNLRRPLHYGVRVQDATVAKYHGVANYGVRTDLHARAKLRGRSDRGLQVDVGHAHSLVSSAFAAGGFGSRSTILHISVASAQSCPSTVALPSSFAKSPPRQESTLISSFN